ncbi:hypothetical protein [Terrimonas alba]|uniref:hypothetical protein n=1 Tax=Terrimonas alba TaxID=3349636 RepID=UPI0035F3FDD4
MIEMFSAFISNSTKVNIAYGNRLDTSQIIIDTTISKMSEVEKIKNFIVQTGERDTCYHLSGTITFLNSSEDGFVIDFSLDPQCPAYYFYTEDKPVSFKMSYQSGMYLSELQNILLNNRPK